MDNIIPPNPPLKSNTNQNNRIPNSMPPLVQKPIQQDNITAIPDKPIRPMFVSLAKYKELKKCIISLQQESKSLGSLISNLKSNKDTGGELLKETVNRLENIEEKVTQINSTIRI